jgi:hypothetical protein
LAASSITAWSLSPLLRQQDTPRAANSQGPRRKTLREMAQGDDVEVVSEPETEVEYDDLRLLAKAANAIVVGHVTSAESSFDGDNSIFTAHKVVVERVLKDATGEVPLLPEWASPAPLTPDIKLVRQGGVVHVNGHRASVKTSGQESLAVGRKYVFFLWWSPNFKAYYLAGGNAGAVLIDGRRVARPLGKAFKTRYPDSDVESFIAEALK